MSLKNYGVLKGRPIARRVGTGASPHYQVHLIDTVGGWKIDGITLRVLYVEGNQAIPALARERAART